MKVIDRVDAVTKKRIGEAIRLIPKGDIKSLQGTSGVYRLRIGNWRIIFKQPDEDTILIENIAPRGQVYKEGWD
jgi:mRNA interferase RelE/StbE